MWPVREYKAANVNMLDACGTRWESKEDFVSDKHRLIYADEKNNMKRVEFLLEQDMKKWDLE